MNKLESDWVFGFMQVRYQMLGGPSLAPAWYVIEIQLDQELFLSSWLLNFPMIV